MITQHGILPTEERWMTLGQMGGAPTVWDSSRKKLLLTIAVVTCGLYWKGMQTAGTDGISKQTTGRGMSIQMFTSKIVLKLNAKRRTGAIL
jgi:hypothetical protein